MSRACKTRSRDKRITALHDAVCRSLCYPDVVPVRYWPLSGAPCGPVVGQSRPAWSSRYRSAETPAGVHLQNVVLRHEIFVLQEELLIQQAGGYGRSLKKYGTARLSSMCLPVGGEFISTAGHSERVRIPEHDRTLVQFVAAAAKSCAGQSPGNCRSSRLTFE